MRKVCSLACFVMLWVLIQWGLLLVLNICLAWSGQTKEAQSLVVEGGVWSKITALGLSSADVGWSNRWDTVLTFCFLTPVCSQHVTCEMWNQTGRVDDHNWHNFTFKSSNWVKFQSEQRHKYEKLTCLAFLSLSLSLPILDSAVVGGWSASLFAVSLEISHAAAIETCSEIRCTRHGTYCTQLEPNLHLKPLSKLSRAVGLKMHYLPYLEHKSVGSEQVKLVLRRSLVLHDGKQSVCLYQVVQATHFL